MIRLKFERKLMAILGLTTLTMSTVVGVVIPHQNSVLAQEVCACVPSEAGPQEGQHRRSSGNFTTEGCSTTLTWELQGAVSVLIMEDIKDGKDKEIYRVRNGEKKDNPNKRSIYVADPEGATEDFTVCALNTHY